MTTDDAFKVRQIERTDYSEVKSDAAREYRLRSDMKYLLGLVKRLDKAAEVK